MGIGISCLIRRYRIDLSATRRGAWLDAGLRKRDKCRRVRPGPLPEHPAVQRNDPSPGGAAGKEAGRPRRRGRLTEFARKKGV